MPALPCTSEAVLCPKFRNTDTFNHNLIYLPPCQNIRNHMLEYSGWDGQHTERRVPGSADKMPGADSEILPEGWR